MPQSVVDNRSNSNEQIDHAAKTIGRYGTLRQKVFSEIYRGKQKEKPVSELAKKLSVTAKRILEEGVKLRKGQIISQRKIRGGETAYIKDDFIALNREKILRCVKNPGELEKFPTKNRPLIKSVGGFYQVSLPRKVVDGKELTIDDIDSFEKVRRIKRQNGFLKISEIKFKNGIKKILREKNRFTDWGGEINDLLTTRMKYRGHRKRTAFAFKGPGKSGELTPAKMGKNGDQIQRLFKSAGEIFVVQYWGKIGDSVIEQIKAFAQLKSFWESTTIYYCIIDGYDSKRIIEAYPKAFR